MTVSPDPDSTAVDTSAVVAVLSDEAEAAAITELLVDRHTLMSAATWTELMIVCQMRGGPSLVADCEELLTEVEMQFQSVSARDAALAFDAYRRFGKGTGHPASLNFGDCFAYALAKGKGIDLLFKGDDFTRTDVSPTKLSGA